MATATAKRRQEVKRDKLMKRAARMELERLPIEPRWQEIEEVMLPGSTEWLRNDPAQNLIRQDEDILDCTATLSLRSLGSGFLGGYTSPSRPWMNYTVENPWLAENDNVKTFCYGAQQVTMAKFGKSNLYEQLATLFMYGAAYGTAVMIVDDDIKDVFRFTTLATGSFWISHNARQVVDCLYRKFRLTVRDLVEKFATKDKSGNVTNWENFSEYVRNLYENNDLEQQVDVAHMIQPNPDYRPGNPFSKFKEYESCYWEIGSVGKNNSYIEEGAVDYDRYLRESGYKVFPAVCARWDRSGMSIYATGCPGFTALGDTNMLQVLVRRALQAIEKMVNPALNAPASIQAQGATIVSGETNWVSDVEKQGVRPVHEVEPDIAALQQYIEQVRQRIRAVMYEDVILMLTRSDLRNMTATEIEARNDEKMLSFGPVLQQLNDGVVKPLIDICFPMLLEAGYLPEVPDELRGQDLKIELISMMAQSQKMVELGPLERFVNFASLIVKADPRALAKIDTDELLDVYAKLVSLQPKIVRTDEQVAAMRAADAKIQAQQMQAEQVQAAAKAGKDMGTTPTDGNTVLSGLLDTIKAGRMPTQMRRAA